MINDRRIGRFTISVDFINDLPQVVRKVMGACIVLRADFNFYSKGITYDALCEDFDELALGNEIPRYTPLFWKNDDGSITFEKWRRGF